MIGGHGRGAHGNADQKCRPVPRRPGGGRDPAAVGRVHQPAGDAAGAAAEAVRPPGRRVPGRVRAHAAGPRAEPADGHLLRRRAERLLVAESGIDGSEPHVFGYHLADGARTSDLYPFERTVSFYPTGFVIYGPVGGMVATTAGSTSATATGTAVGVITAFGYDGRHTTIVANLPAQGDYGVTDLVVDRGPAVLRRSGRRPTAASSAWTTTTPAGSSRYPDVCDQVSAGRTTVPLVLNGSRFDTRNPAAGLGQPDIVVTTPLQPFGHGNQSRIRPAGHPQRGRLLGRPGRRRRLPGRWLPACTTPAGWPWTRSSPSCSPPTTAWSSAAPARSPTTPTC